MPGLLLPSGAGRVCLCIQGGCGGGWPFLVALFRFRGRVAPGPLGRSDGGGRGRQMEFYLWRHPQDHQLPCGIANHVAELLGKEAVVGRGDCDGGVPLGG